jgi:hypothetical protein
VAAPLDDFELGIRDANYDFAFVLFNRIELVEFARKDFATLGMIAMGLVDTIES